MRLIRRDSLTPQPWKNGGGVTREIAAHPPGVGMEHFDWRISMAEVAADGPFSAFPGIDRTLTVLDGRGLTLDFGGGAVALDPGAPLSFPGEAAVTARLSAGPISDLNVMTRRAVLRHHATPLAQGDAAPAGTVALVLLAGTAEGAAGDTWLADGGDLDGCAAPAPALAVVLTPVAPRNG